jgi:hypothetical protein
MMTHAMSPDTQRDLELEALRTRVANQAASLAEIVTDGFRGFHLGAADYVVELMAPEGQSTGGGALARQHIRLVPRRRGHPVVVVGTVDAVSRVAEVRTFDHVSLLHQVRFGRDLQIHAEEYGNFLAKLNLVFSVARIRRTISFTPPDLIASVRGRASSGQSSLSIMATFVFVLLATAFLVYRAMR